MKRIVLWALSTVSALVLLFGYHTSTSGPTTTTATNQPVFAGTVADPTAATPSATPTPAAGAGADPGATPTPTVTPTPTPAPATSSTVTGSTAQTRWGPVQVELTVASGAITAVRVVQYPNGNPRDTEINARALPVLINETLDAQSASIDMVSGATVTSDGYVESLQSAIDQAGL